MVVFGMGVRATAENRMETPNIGPKNLRVTELGTELLQLACDGRVGL
jgi:hypothetical protein